MVTFDVSITHLAKSTLIKLHIDSVLMERACRFLDGSYSNFILLYYCLTRLKSLILNGDKAPLVSELAASLNVVRKATNIF